MRSWPTARAGTRSSSRSSAAAGEWSGRGSSSFASRRRGRGRSDGRTSSRRPRRGSGPRTSFRKRHSTTSYGATSQPSGRRRARTSHSGRGCDWETSRRPSSGSRSGASATRTGESSSICRELLCPIQRPRRPCGSCPRGTRCCSSMHGARVSCRSVTGRGSSRRRCRSRSERFSSTVLWPGRGAIEHGRIRWEAFERLDRASVREVDDEAERLAAFHA